MNSSYSIHDAFKKLRRTNRRLRNDLDLRESEKIDFIEKLRVIRIENSSLRKELEESERNHTRTFKYFIGTAIFLIIYYIAIQILQSL